MLAWLKGPKHDWLWQIKTPHSTMGAHGPFPGPDASSFFMDDGWGTSFASLRLRRFSAPDGSEIDSCVVKGPVYGLALSADRNTGFVHAGSRLIEFNTQSMRQLRTWKSGIPESGKLIALCGNCALFGTLIHQTLTLLDTDNSKVKRRRIGSCYGAVQIDEGRMLLLSGREGRIWEYDCDAMTVRLFADVGEFSRWSHSRAAEALFLSLGPKLTFTDHSVEWHRYGPIIVHLDLKTRTAIKSYSAEEKLNDFFFSSQGDYGYLAAERSVALVHMTKNRFVDDILVRLPSGWEVRALLEDTGIGLAISRETMEDAQLAAFKLPTP